MNQSKHEWWSITHAISFEDAHRAGEMRAAVAWHKGQLRGTAARQPFDAIMENVAAPANVRYEPDRVGGIAGWWSRVNGSPESEVILYLHGGWFNWGSAEAYRNFAGQIAARSGVDTFIPDYRLAPEHPFPAGLDDVLACYGGLIQRGLRKIAVAGDSAGGCLCLVMLALVATGSAFDGVIPLAGAAMSPVTDLALQGDSWTTRAVADPLFTKHQAAELVRAYFGDADPADPRVSPLYGNVAGLPPLRIQVGEDEVLFDDSKRYVDRVVQSGGDARLDVWEGMPHVFQAEVGKFNAAAQALDEVSAFLSDRLTS